MAVGCDHVEGLRFRSEQWDGRRWGGGLGQCKCLHLLVLLKTLANTINCKLNYVEMHHNIGSYKARGSHKRNWN